MASTFDKARPRYAPAETTMPLAPGIVAVETHAPAGGATTIRIRRDAGEALATVTVADAARSRLAETFPAGALATTAHLTDLACGDPAFAAHALYLAVRRARIRGATTIVVDTDAPSTLPLALVPLATPGAHGQRVDLAAAAAAAAAGPLDPVVYGDEVFETFHVWLRDLYGRGFFRAIAGGTLGRGQYVYVVSNMHQFVRWTTRLLGHAVAHAHARPMREHFLAHLQGELNHELIIERDLAHLGEDVEFVVERMAASPGTRLFMAVQESQVGFHHDLVQFLASPLAAEGVASHLDGDFLVAMERTIASWGVREPRKAMSFFTSHVHTDGGVDGHWELVLARVRAHLRCEDDVRRFLGVARASMRALTMLYDEAVEDVAIFA